MMGEETICVFNVVVRCKPEKYANEEFDIVRYLSDMESDLLSVNIIDVSVDVVGKYSKYRPFGEGGE